MVGTDGYMEQCEEGRIISFWCLFFSMFVDRGYRQRCIAMLFTRRAEVLPTRGTQARWTRAVFCVLPVSGCLTLLLTPAPERDPVLCLFPGPPRLAYCCSTPSTILHSPLYYAFSPLHLPTRHSFSPPGFPLSPPRPQWTASPRSSCRTPSFPGSLH